MLGKYRGSSRVGVATLVLVFAVSACEHRPEDHNQPSRGKAVFGIVQVSVDPLPGNPGVGLRVDIRCEARKQPGPNRDKLIMSAFRDMNDGESDTLFIKGSEFDDQGQGDCSFAVPVNKIETPPGWVCTGVTITPEKVVLEEFSLKEIREAKAAAERPLNIIAPEIEDAFLFVTVTPTCAERGVAPPPDETPAGGPAGPSATTTKPMTTTTKPMTTTTTKPMTTTTNAMTTTTM